ncbi:hypothetical protein GQ473_07080 [archaeon]|nr:hypothetical protein [archaeon]
MRKFIFILLILTILPSVFADTCNPEPKINSLVMSATSIALTSDPWSNKVVVDLNWSLEGTTDCKNAIITMKSDLENIYFTEKKYDSIPLGENISTNMDVIFLSSAVPGNDYLQVFVNCDNTNCNTSSGFSDSYMLLFKITPLECITNENCSKTQYCKVSTKQCLELDCEICDKIENHTCISTCDDADICTVDFCGAKGICKHNITESCCQSDTDCNDNLFCTNETCINNKCLYKNITCESSNPCEMGLCIEPTGCKIYNITNCTNDLIKKTPSNEQKTTISEKIETLKGPSIPDDKNVVVIGIIILLLIVKFTFLR